MAEQVSTGLTGLDAVLNYLRKSDNVVWKVPQIKTPLLKNKLPKCGRLFSLYSRTWRRADQ